MPGHWKTVSVMIAKAISAPTCSPMIVMTGTSVFLSVWPKWIALLLSPRAQVDTKPQLEIFADDVKCAHGATVGQLDADEMFYLRSRGLDEPAARNLLTYAFAADVVERIPVPSVVRAVERVILEQIQEKQ